MLALSNMISYLATRARCVRGDGTQTRQPQQQLQKRGNSRPVRLAWFCHGAHKRQELSNTWKQPPTEHIINSVRSLAAHSQKMFFKQQHLVHQKESCLS